MMLANLLTLLRSSVVMTACGAILAMASHVSAMTVIDDNFDDGDLTTNTGGIGSGFIVHAQDQAELGPPFVANPHEAGGAAVLESDPDNGWSLASIVSNDVFTLSPAGVHILYYYSALNGESIVGVADQSYSPGPGNGGTPFHPAFSIPGGLFVDADAAGLVGGVLDLFLTDADYSVNGGALSAHSLGAATVRLGASYQGPTSASSTIDRIVVNTVPEPAGVALLGLAATTLYAVRRRRVL